MLERMKITNDSSYISPDQSPNSKKGLLNETGVVLNKLINNNMQSNNNIVKLNTYQSMQNIKNKQINYSTKNSRADIAILNLNNTMPVDDISFKKSNKNLNIYSNILLNEHSKVIEEESYSLKPSPNERTFELNVLR